MLSLLSHWKAPIWKKNKKKHTHTKTKKQQKNQKQKKKKEKEKTELSLSTKNCKSVTEHDKSHIFLSSLNNIVSF